jgi:hypothetical protein
MRGARVLLFVLAAAVSAQAQPAAKPASGDAGRVGVNATLHGLVYGGDIGVGVTMHLTDHLALRPAFSFTHHTEDREGTHDYESLPSYDSFSRSRLGPETLTSDREADGSALSVALLWYFAEKQGLRPYVGAGYEHRKSSASETTLVETPTYHYFSYDRPPRPAAYESRTLVEQEQRHRLGSLFLGAEHAFGRRCRAFAQVGVDYGSHARDERRVSVSTDPSRCAQCFPPPVVRTSSDTTTSNGKGRISGSFCGMLGLTFYLN